MSGRSYRQNEENCLNKDITVGCFLLPTGATLSRNQRFFLKSARPNKSGTIFLRPPQFKIS